MKYFTRQLWIDAQEPGESGREAGQRWADAFTAYAHQLESLRLRLPPDVFDFFQNADVHDGALMHLRLRDFDPLAPKSPTHPEAPDADWDGEDDPWEGSYRLTVELAVVAWGPSEWTLRYSGIRRILVDFPSEPPLFFRPGDGFEDWGYHELSDAGDGFLRHEVLFSSGAVVLVEFRDVSVTRSLRPTS